MARAKKDSEARTFRLSPEILKRLDYYSEETSIPKTAVVEKSLKMYLDANEQDIGAEKNKR